MLDSNIFKESLADAKAIRHVALANAKVQLEEAFSERYNAMFSEKLREDAGMSNPSPTPTPSPEATPSATPTEPSAEQGGTPDVSEQEIDELIKELESQINAPVAGAPAPDASPAVPGATVPGAEVPPMPATAPLATNPTAVPTAPPTPGTEMNQTPPSEVPQTETDEDVNLEELLQQLKEQVEDESDEKEEEEECVNEETKLKSSGIGPGGNNKQPATAAKSSSHVETAHVKNHGWEDGKQIAKDATEASRPNEAKNATSTNLSTPSMGGSTGKSDAARPNSKGEFGDTKKLHEENVGLKKQLDEAVEAITVVKQQLNEVNLLNSKLLFTNKLFKEFSMTNEQKMRIIEMFDLSKTDREVKLTYANIAESFNIGGNMKKSAPLNKPSISSITEGIASSTVGSTKPNAQIISEHSGMVSKFQKLAGIKKQVLNENKKSN